MRCGCRATRAARSRSIGRGRRAPDSSSRTFRKSRRATPAFPRPQSPSLQPPGVDSHVRILGAAEQPQKEHGMTATARIDLDIDTISKAYARWAPVYDLVFGAVLDPGRHAAIAAAERIGGRILEVGVGTGISLPEY